MNLVRKLKVLYTTADSSSQSGAFRQILYMSEGIRNHDYQPVLVLHKAVKNSLMFTSLEHIQAYFLDLPRLRRGQPIGYYFRYCQQNMQSIYEIARVIRQEEVSLVHINEIIDIYAAVAARVARIPCVWHVRAGLSSTPKLGLLFGWLVSLLAKSVVVVSNSVENQIFKQNGLSTDKTVVIYDPGPDLTIFGPKTDGGTVRAEYDVNGRTKLVVLVAKLAEPKGHKTLIHAVPKICELYPDTKFLIVGGELAGTHYKLYAQELKRLTLELGMQEQIIFTGYRSDIPQIMAAADIVVHCSTYPDPFPGVVLQGMALGKPVIASNIGGPQEQIEHDCSGILVEPNNPDALAKAIYDLLSNEDKRIRLGKAAITRVSTNFSDELFFRKLTTTYHNVLDSKS